MSLRAIKAKARTDLHEAMKVAAYYLAARGSDPLPISVRVHTSFRALGDLKGTSFSYAETEAAVPRLIFWLSQCDPQNKALITISADEGYRVDHTLPPDGLTITAEVVRLAPNEMVGLPYPPAGA